MDKAKAEKEKAKASEDAAAEAQGASKQMSFQEMISVKKAKDSLPEAPAPKAEKKENKEKKEHKPKDLDQKVAELNEKGAARMKTGGYTEESAFGTLREPTEQEKEVARKRAALMDPLPASVGIAPVALTADAAAPAMDPYAAPEAPAAAAAAPVVLAAPAAAAAAP